MSGSKGGLRRTWGQNAARALACAAVLSVILLSVASVPISSATPITGAVRAANGGTIWAYGGTQNASVNWQGEHGQFIGTASYGFSTTLTQTNTSNTTYYLTENHTVGASLQLTYCQPNCTSARLSANFDAHAWEQWTSIASFTTTGSVTLRNGTTVPALALVSATTQAEANLSESLSLSANGTTHIVRMLFVATSANLSVAFAPALGLVPLNLTEVQSWTATSQFSASGNWQTSFLSVGPGGAFNSSRSGNLTGTGNVTLYGSDSHYASDSLGATPMQGWTRIAVRLGAPMDRHGSSDLGLGFDLQDGFALVPRVADIWAGTGNWGPSMALTTSADTSGIDSTGLMGPHLGLDSAEWSYSTSVNQYDSPTNSSPSVVQGSPMSPSAAEASASCLTGAGCASGAAGPSGILPSPIWVVVGLVAATVVGLAAVVLVRRK
jgi:hypothetical protein